MILLGKIRRIPFTSAFFAPSRNARDVTGAKGLYWEALNLVFSF